MTFWLSY